MVNILEVDGKEIPFSDLTPEDHKRIAERIQDNLMISARIQEKNRLMAEWWTSRKERTMAKLNFIQSQHPRMLSYVECRSDPVFYLVESVPEPEPELDLDDLAGKVMFGICAMFAGCVASALLAGM